MDSEEKGNNSDQKENGDEPLSRLTKVDKWLAVSTLCFIGCVCLPVYIYSFHSFYTHQHHTYFEKRRTILIYALFVMIFLALFVSTTAASIIVVLSVDEVFTNETLAYVVTAVSDDIRAVLLFSIVYVI